MDTATVVDGLARLRKAGRSWELPYIDGQTRQGRDPFKILVACILSLRTRDEVTAGASERLFRRAATPEALVHLPEPRLAELIYPVGFYRVKARTLRALSRCLIEDHAGRVPDTLDGLLTLPGVGRKTANLVVSVGYNRPAICVDTHVHRIMNRWGYVSTRHPDETESVLREKLPVRCWKGLNSLLVRFGQNVCQPVSPWCSRCPVAHNCPRRGVKRSR